MSSNKNQHYVPQFYLKGFETENKLFVFDIVNKKEFITNSRNIGAENYFHNIDKRIINAFYNSDREDFVDNVLNSSIEKYYSRFMDIFSDIDRELKNAKHGHLIKFNKKVVDQLINYMIVQYIRTRKFREKVKSIGVMTYDLIKKHNMPVEISKDEFTRISHLNILYKGLCLLGYADPVEFKINSQEYDSILEDFIKAKRNKLLNCGKTFILNQSKKTFFTSDAPVIFESLGNGNVEFSLSYFPINKVFAILFHDDKKLPEVRRFDKSILVISDDKIDILENLNLHIVRGAERFVFNGITDFDKLPSYINGDFKSRLELY